MPIEFSTTSSRLTVLYRQPRKLTSYLACGVAVIWVTYFVTHLPPEFRNPKTLGDFTGIFFTFLIIAALGGALIFQFAGTAELEFSDSALTIRRILFGFASTKIISLDELSEPYFVEEEQRGRSKSPSRMRFDLMGRQVDCCTWIRGDEVYEIVLRIREAFPELAKRWGSGGHMRSKDLTLLNLN